MLRLVHKHVKMCKHAAKKLSFLIKYLPGWYKTQQICAKVTLENGGMMFISDYYKDQSMCNKAVDKYAHALGPVPNCYGTQKMCNKAVMTYPSAIQFAPDWVVHL